MKKLLFLFALIMSVGFIFSSCKKPTDVIIPASTASVTSTGETIRKVAATFVREEITGDESGRCATDIRTHSVEIDVASGGITGIRVTPNVVYTNTDPLGKFNVYIRSSPPGQPSNPIWSKRGIQPPLTAMGEFNPNGNSAITFPASTTGLFEIAIQADPGSSGCQTRTFIYQFGL